MSGFFLLCSLSRLIKKGSVRAVPTLALLIFLGATLNVSAQPSTLWENDRETSWPQNTHRVGSSNEYVIDNERQLAQFAYIVRTGTTTGTQMGTHGCPADFLGWTVRLTRTMELGTNRWQPIGELGQSTGRVFRGTFDGGNFDIAPGHCRGNLRNAFGCAFAVRNDQKPKHFTVLPARP